MAKLPIQRIQWNIWISCNEDDFDLEIEVPVWFEDIVRSAENSYSDIVSALDAIVKSQQVPDKVKISHAGETITIDTDNLSPEAKAVLLGEINKSSREDFNFTSLERVKLAKMGYGESNG